MSVGLSSYLAQQTKLRDGAGRVFAGYFNDSATHARRAVIVVHDYFGLTPQVRIIANRLASEGFLSFAPDLYRERVATTREEAERLARQLAWNQVAVELGLAVSTLKQRRPEMRVAVLGFAMGGAAAVVAAAAVPHLDAAVTFYGIPQDVCVEDSHVRVQGHFATRDAKCTPERVSAFEQSLADRGVTSEIYRYEADNGFFNPLRPEVYSPRDAERAWARTLLFLRDALT